MYSGAPAPESAAAGYTTRAQRACTPELQLRRALRQAIQHARSAHVLRSSSSEERCGRLHNTRVARMYSGAPALEYMRQATQQARSAHVLRSSSSGERCAQYTTRAKRACTPELQLRRALRTIHNTCVARMYSGAPAPESAAHATQHARSAHVLRSSGSGERCARYTTRAKRACTPELQLRRVLRTLNLKTCFFHTA